MLHLLEETQSIWDRLNAETRPIVLYGMGDGGDKILDACQSFSIPVQGVFASDGFVRTKTFRGFPVRTLAQTEEALGRELVVLLAFATQRPDVLAQIAAVARRHTLLVPDLPVCGREPFTPGLLSQYNQEALAVDMLWADEQSRRVYRDILSYKISGKPEYLHRCARPRVESLGLLRLGTEEIFVDAGAYNGDTVEEFITHTGGRYREIHALEPDRRNFAKLQRWVELLDPARIHCHQLGAWKERDLLFFQHKSGRQAALSATGGTPTPVDSIDNILAGGAATYINYDVEGAEREALAGSRETIRRYSPALLVSAYHRNEDLFALPLQIQALNPAYRLYLRRPPYLPAWDIHILAVAPKADR